MRTSLDEALLMEIRSFQSQKDVVDAVVTGIIELAGQAAPNKLNVVLTGGGIGIEVVRQLGVSGISPSQLRVIFCDERFVPADSPDRNESQALQAWPDLTNADLLAYPLPEDGLEQAAATFSQRLNQDFGPVNQDADVFDLVLLGVGEDGHIASLFPGVQHPSNWIVSEFSSPKPPVERLSLSYEALNRSKRVWFVTAGAQKADAVRRALDGEVPASRVSGNQETIWWIDKTISDEL
jgi:6-phosphogluconolactonase